MYLMKRRRMKKNLLKSCPKNFKVKDIEDGILSNQGTIFSFGNLQYIYH